ncbi:hypothetical protein C7H19_01405 [Aphanothece hegewaldii CCALA 016]|uniref:DUF1350 domain-containing protein n=1 Tax=Aphanothece hegewaldii CCALA 016 TaxID=2107694 RepID=A0A2T1M3Q3_9CHRO|nr:DUF1350 family protein [Aphanothece hegewaldii]PSF39473.1 hypothetical protein C7H19_01405 [Aphanothece hegewaldii CCALA 016]
MYWQEMSGSWVLIPRQPVGIVHFLGGAFVATAPHITYRWLLENLGKSGYAVIATPFVNTLDHSAIALSVLNRFESILERLQSTGKLKPGYLPIYGMGHSMGCKLHLLIGSLFQVERDGNILISFNNYPVKRAIPFIEPLALDVKTLNLEFVPSPEETQDIIAKNYLVRRNLLIRFSNDDIDQTSILNPILMSRFPNMIASLNLPGNHLTPLGQEMDWKAGEIFTPFDAVGQWFKKEFSRDVYRLRDEVLRWLNPEKFFK